MIGACSLTDGSTVAYSIQDGNYNCLTNQFYINNLTSTTYEQYVP
jgi:hypothetical protein